MSVSVIGDGLHCSHDHSNLSSLTARYRLQRPFEHDGVRVVGSVRPCRVVQMAGVRSRTASPGWRFLLSSALLRGCCLTMLLLPIHASAQDVLTVRPVNVWAGPDREFPLVISFPPRTKVHIFGCLEGWQWCDVASGRSRGWAHVSDLGNFFRDRTPIVEFSVDTYWDAHYRGRPWYADRSRWLKWEPSMSPPR